MNRSCCFLAVSILTFGGCAASPRQPSKLIQLNDEQWVDLSDVREIEFFRNPSNPNAPVFSITVVHRGPAENSFSFNYTDQAAAYASWKRLTAQLGGKLNNEDSWKTEANVVAAIEKSSPTTQFATNVTAANDSYSQFKLNLNELGACRDKKLITDAEYQRGHDADIAGFASSLGNGGSYTGMFGELHTELSQLEKLKSDHLMSDENIASVRRTIISRYIPAPG